MSRLLLLNKPHGVLCRFGAEAGHRTLGELVRVPGVYPAGRLDADSEGLLALTDDGRLQAAIANPRHELAKTYWAQVEGRVEAVALERLRGGLQLRDGATLPAEAREIEAPAWLWPRDRPIRVRRHIPTSWIELRIREGRNRQVRRMTAAVGLPTLRLVRYGIGPWNVEGLAPGQWREVDAARAWSDLRRS